MISRRGFKHFMIVRVVGLLASMERIVPDGIQHV